MGGCAIEAGDWHMITKNLTMRIYLARNIYDEFSRKKNMDGGFNVIGANGFERLDGASGKKR